MVKKHELKVGDTVTRNGKQALIVSIESNTCNLVFLNPEEGWEKDCPIHNVKKVLPKITQVHVLVVEHQIEDDEDDEEDEDEEDEDSSIMKQVSVDKNSSVEDCKIAMLKQLNLGSHPNDWKLGTLGKQCRVARDGIGFTGKALDSPDRLADAPEPYVLYYTGEASWKIKAKSWIKFPIDPPKTPITATGKFIICLDTCTAITELEVLKTIEENRHTQKPKPEHVVPTTWGKPGDPFNVLLFVTNMAEKELMTKADDKKIDKNALKDFIHNERFTLYPYEAALSHSLFRRIDLLFVLFYEAVLAGLDQMELYDFAYLEEVIKRDSCDVGYPALVFVWANWTADIPARYPRRLPKTWTEFLVGGKDMYPFTNPQTIRQDFRILCEVAILPAFTEGSVAPPVFYTRDLTFKTLYKRLLASEKSDSQETIVRLIGDVQVFANVKEIYDFMTGVKNKAN